MKVKLSNGAEIAVQGNMRVKALKQLNVDYRNRNLTIKQGSICYIYHWPPGSLEIGKAGNGNVHFRAYASNAKEGIDFELIDGEQPREHWYA